MITNGKIQMIVLDLDGTLLMGNGRIHPQNIQPIRRAIAAGVPVILATGKTRWSALEVIEILGLETPGVFTQGMVISDADGVVRRSVTLATAVTADILEYATERHWSVNAYCPDGLRSTVDDRFRHLLHTKYHEPLPAFCPDLHHQLDAVQINKLLISDGINDGTNNDATRADLERRFSGEAAVIQAVPEYIELLPLGVSKGEGVRWLLAEMGINPAAIMAVGDGENDLELLRMAGLGVAMGNAHDSVKASADVVVSTNEAAGVAEAIEHFVL